MATPLERTHYFSETALIGVAIGQSYLVLYAAVGGLLALLVDSYVLWTKKRLTFAFWSFLGKVTGSMLLSAAITAISSRLSTTSFPLKVAVDDFWGALTIGFVAYFLGAKFLDKLTNSRELKDQSGCQELATMAPASSVPAEIPIKQGVSLHSQPAGKSAEGLAARVAKWGVQLGRSRPETVSSRGEERDPQNG